MCTAFIELPRLCWERTAVAGVIGCLQPPGDGDAAADGDDIGARPGDSGDHRRLEVVDSVGTQTQQTGAVRVQADDGAGLL